MRTGKTVLESCQFCGSESFSVAYASEHWRIEKCADCGFCFTNPRPHRADLPAYYSAEYFADQRHVKKFFRSDGTKRIKGVSYTNRIADVEHHVSERGSVLEIGAAKGGFLAALRDRGWDADGVEISADGVREAMEDHGLELFCGEIEDYRTDKRYDVICMYQTFEHVWNPVTTLEKCRSLLKPKGILIIEVPNRRAFEMRYSARRRELSYDLPRHLSHFSPRFLARESRMRGFEMLEADLYHAPPVLKLLGLLAEIRSHSKGKISDSARRESTIPQPPSLMRKSSGKKIRVLKELAKLMPGWRFTLTLRKKD